MQLSKTKFSFLEEDCRADALELVREETRQAAAQRRASLAKMARLPCAYTLFRLGAKRFLRQNYPAAGWETEWVQADRKALRFDFHRCLYHELTSAHGCPELCRVYCENDEITFSGLLPRIRFQRSGTLGGGADRCDFRFVPGREAAP